jgi:hypothetical protein
VTIVLTPTGTGTLTSTALVTAQAYDPTTPNIAVQTTQIVEHKLYVPFRSGTHSRRGAVLPGPPAPPAGRRAGGG